VAGISLVFLPAGEVSIVASREGIAKATDEGVEIVCSTIEGAEVQVTYRRWPESIQDRRIRLRWFTKLGALCGEDDSYDT
jgi:hypothetical protein